MSLHSHTSETQSIGYRVRQDCGDGKGQRSCTSPIGIGILTECEKAIRQRYFAPGSEVDSRPGLMYVDAPL